MGLGFCVTYVQNKDGEVGLGLVSAHPLPRGLNILLELLDGVLQGGAGIVNLVDDEDVLADEVLHGAEGGHVEPLGAGDLGAGLLDLVVAERLVEGQTDGLDGDVGGAGLLEEGSQDAGGDVAAATDCDHELRLHLGEETGSRLLAQLVHLGRRNVSSCASLMGGASCGSYATAGVTYIVVSNVDLLDHGGGDGGGGVWWRGRLSRKTAGVEDRVGRCWLGYGSNSRGGMLPEREDGESKESDDGEMRVSRWCTRWMDFFPRPESVRLRLGLDSRRGRPTPPKNLASVTEPRDAPLPPSTRGLGLHSVSSRVDQWTMQGGARVCLYLCLRQFILQ